MWCSMQRMSFIFTCGFVPSATFAVLTFIATLTGCKAAKPRGEVADAQPAPTRPPAADAAPACRTGDECYALGDSVLPPKATDPPKAEYYLRRGCELGHARACASLGSLLMAGLTLKRDERRALSLFEEACRLNDLQSCRAVASLISEGSETPGAIPKNPAKGAEIYEAACRAGEGPSCFALIHIYETGRGVPRDKRRAREFARLAKKHGFEGE